MASVGGIEPFDMDQMMELDVEVHHHESSVPVSSLSTMADSLPGLGIVAAVLGVVITMGALGGPPEQIGHKVAAALVGTFLGMLLCYGFVGPISSNMAKNHRRGTCLLSCIPCSDCEFHQGLAAFDCRRIRAARHTRSAAARFRRTGQIGSFRPIAPIRRGC